MMRAGVARLLSKRRGAFSRGVPGVSVLAARLVDQGKLTSAPADSPRGPGESLPPSSLGDVRRFSSGNGSATGASRAESIYLHHTDVGSAVNSAGVTIGLMHALQGLAPGVGYFRPIDATSHGGRRAELIRDIFKLKTPVEDMAGITQDEALRLIAAGRLDDLFEFILPAYERCKREHDYVVVEGTSMRDGSNTSPINGLMAATLNCPAILLNDAEAAAGANFAWRQMRTASMEEVDWEREAVASVADHSRIMHQNNVDVRGALFYRVPHTSRGSDTLRETLQPTGIPLLGAIPEDDQLEALQLEDVRRLLDAEVVYGEGEHLPSFMATDINKVLVATLHLEDFLSYVPNAKSTTEGSLVITHASRPDVLLGCMALHETTLPTHIAGVVLTGGLYPPVDIDTMIRARLTPSTLPVLLSPMGTSSTVMAIANAKGQVHATSARKIERAQVLFQGGVDMGALNRALFREKPLAMNASMFQHLLFVKAQEAQQHIVLPEGEETRTVQAAGEVLRRGLCKLTLLGEPSVILRQAKHLRVDLTGASIVDAASSPDLEELAGLVHEKRKHKGMSFEQAKEMVSGDVTYFGTAMVAAGLADGMVSGAVHTTAATVRPALQIIKTFPDTPIVSSVFFMCLPDKVLVYGDCAVNENPSPEELAMIAISSADTATAFGIEPRVAMLSYATGDSNSGPMIQKVADATLIARERRPDLAIEGPLQYDAAVNAETARTKMKGKESAVAGKATVLIFPDLNTGNNTYKAVQQSTGAVAMGPVLQGLRKPVNDLSRGCTVRDIVTTIAITCVQAYGMKQGK